VSSSEFLETALSAPDLRAALPAIRELARSAGDLSALLPRLAQALADAHPQTARRAAGIHGLLGPLVRDNLPALLAALASKRWTVREAVVQALGRVATEDPSVRVALVRSALFDRVGAVREQAVSLLARWAKEALPEVRAALLHHHPRVRCRALQALARWASPHEQVSVFRTALDDSHFRVRRDAAALLGGLGPLALPALARLARRRFDGEPRVARSAEQSLARLAPELPAELGGWLACLTASGAEQSLRAALRDRELPPGVREDFIAVCGRRREMLMATASQPAAGAVGQTPREQLESVLAAAGKRSGRQASWLVGWLLDELVRRHQGTTR
jgi:HEAT repeat protein